MLVLDGRELACSADRSSPVSPSPIGRLDKAWDEAIRRKWTVVDMKNDWKVIYPFEMK